MSIRKHITAKHVSVCKYNKFGYCKFQEGCKRIHVTEICENWESCTKLRSCHKRQPKVCKLYELENSCRFGSACSYLHLSSNKQSETEQRLRYLENRLKDMTSKIMALEYSEATSKLSKATWRIYGKLMLSCKLRDKIQSKWLTNTIFALF